MPELHELLAERPQGVADDPLVEGVLTLRAGDRYARVDGAARALGATGRGRAPGRGRHARAGPDPGRHALCRLARRRQRGRAGAARPDGADGTHGADGTRGAGHRRPATPRGRLGGESISHSVDSALYIDFARTIELALTYTPDQNVWWEVSLLVDQLRKTDAAYHAGTVQLLLDPTSAATPSVGTVNTQGYFAAVAAGGLLASNMVVQNATVNNYSGRALRAVVPLTSGATYKVFGKFVRGGGTWTYNHGPTMLRLDGKAWAR